MVDEKQPIYILPENTSRTLGRDAQRNNIMAAKLVADIVKTTLGPKGMDKMLVDSSGNVIVTNDGVTILEEMEIEHPAAKMLVDIAKTQEEEVGDGTTTAALLAGKFLEQAEFLLDKKIHPTTIVKGYKLAAEQSKHYLNELAMPVENNEILRQIAMTAMTGKGAEGYKEHLANLIVDAISQVADGRQINQADIKIEKLKGESIKDSELIRGIVISKERVSNEMPSKIEDARILLLDTPLEIRNPETETKISVSTPEQLEQFINAEENYLKNITDKVIFSGANVVFCQKGIDDTIQYYLAQKGIFACRRITKSDMEMIAKATSGKILSSLHELNPSCLGNSQSVEEIRHTEDSLIYIKGCPNPRAVTLLIRGGTSHVIDEIERAVKDGLGDVSASLKSSKVVPGGGAIEMALSKRLKGFARTLGGREQLAIEAFAQALESIPETLAENAGLDPIDVLTELRKSHEAGRHQTGINLLNNKIEDTFAAGIIEPLKVKTQAISSASEVASMILRIDDILVSKGTSAKPRMPYPDLE